MACYGNSCNSGSCYNPCGSSCYPNTAYLCAPPQPCRQTVFRNGNSGNPNVSMSGTHLSSAEGSCTDYTNFQIEGSGLSIVAICIGTEETTENHWKVCTAGTICSCPNNFTTSLYINKLIGEDVLGEPGQKIVQAVGCMSWCVCGCNVCGSGSFTGISAQEEASDPTTFSGTIQVQGTACSACGTRTICINNIHING